MSSGADGLGLQQFATATRLLEPLCNSKSGGSPELHSVIAYIHLQSGNMDGAMAHLEVANSDPSIDPYIRTLNSVLRATAYGEWEYAQKVLEASMDTASEDVQQVIVSIRITGCDWLTKCDYVSGCK